MVIMEEKFDFDKLQAYRLIDVTDKNGISKIENNSLYLRVKNCIVTNIFYDSIPSLDGAYRLNLNFIQDEDGNWINRGIHTSPVLKVEETKKGIEIHTQNSIYVFEKTTINETEKCTHKSIIELFLSLDEDYNFAKGFYWDDFGEPQEMDFNIHVGMFVDTVLIGLPQECAFGEFLCRYFYKATKIEFYDTLYRQQEYSKPLLINNLSKDKALPISFEFCEQNWIIPPSQTMKIIPPERTARK